MGRIETLVGVIALGLVQACANGQNEIDPGGSDAATDMGGANDIPRSSSDDGAVSSDAGVPDTGPCLDNDMDLLDNVTEGAPTLDTDGDGIPDYLDTDSDNDGWLDIDEGRRGYAGYLTSEETWHVCGSAPDNCDGDLLPNQRDLDSDNDGLTDAQERTYRTNPCNADTDGDGYSDLVEVVAGSDPLDPHSVPPVGNIYVTLPYYAPGTTGPHTHQSFTFQTQIREADVFFVVDNSASLDSVITSLSSSLTSTIVPGILTAIPDTRFGVGSFDSMPEIDTAAGVGADGAPGSPGDYTFWRRQALTTNVTSVQAAFDTMHTIAVDTMGAFNGSDEPECQLEALYETIAGTGSNSHTTDAAALRSVNNALDPMGDGWVPAMDAARDCPGATNPFGWACFETGRVPIIILLSDAHWYDGPEAGSPVSRFGHRYADLVPALTSTGAYYVGIDVSSFGTSGFTYANSVQLAMATHTLDASGSEVVFATGAAGISVIANNIVSAISTLVHDTRQDITTSVQADPTAMGLGTHTTADFIVAVTPMSAVPPAPTGYTSSDATTFYGVLPTTQVTFDVDLYNNFLPGGMTAQLFQATIHVLGRAGSEVDHRQVYIVVPALGGGLPPE